jgi:hypothetical protein
MPDFVPGLTKTKLGDNSKDNWHKDQGENGGERKPTNDCYRQGLLQP